MTVLVKREVSFQFILDLNSTIQLKIKDSSFAKSANVLAVGTTDEFNRLAEILNLLGSARGGLFAVNEEKRSRKSCA